MNALNEMPQGQPEDLAHARWRVRFFRHLVEEHRSHPWDRNSQWTTEDAEYSQHLEGAEVTLHQMEEFTHGGVAG